MLKRSHRVAASIALLLAIRPAQPNAKMQKKVLKT
jgi:hypothetical protein